MIGGVIAGVINGAVTNTTSDNANADSMRYIYYVLDLEKDKTKRLNINRMLKLLSFNEELVNQYQKEQDQENAITQRKYVNGV